MMLTPLFSSKTLLLAVAFAASERANGGIFSNSPHYVNVRGDNSLKRLFRKIVFGPCCIIHSACETCCADFRMNVDHVCDIQRDDYGSLSKEVSQWISNQSPIKKSKESIQISSAISAMVEESDRYLSNDVVWDLMGIDKKVTVWKLDKSSIRLNEEDSEWPCVKSSTIIEIEPKALIEYLMDSSKVEEYNRYSAGRLDIEQITSTSKIVWNRMNIPIGIKPYDFCTLVHCYSRPLQDEIYLISKSFIHELVPDNKDYGRSEKIIGLNIVRPLKSTGNSSSPIRTEITCISHQRYANTPPIIIEKSMMRGKVNYLKKLREVLESRS